jgi:serine protease Do
MGDPPALPEPEPASTGDAGDWPPGKPPIRRSGRPALPGRPMRRRPQRDTMCSMNPHPPFADSSALADAVERSARSVVGLALRRGSGSAAVWQPGIAVSAASALWRSSRVGVVLPDGEQVDGSLRGVDAATDLAAIAFDAAAVPPIERNDTAALRAGDFVFAVGREASGLVQASFGHVGAVAGAWRTWRGGRVEALIRLDGGLYPGFAGAPVVGADGRAIGIASPALSRLYGVALPVSTVDRVLAALLSHGRVRQGYLGIAAQPVRAQLGGQAVDGLLVSSVAADGPAAAAGVLVGDVIVHAGGQPVASIDALHARLGGDAVGAPLALALARGGQAVTVQVDVAERAQRGCH